MSKVLLDELQCGPWSYVAFCGIRSGSTPFAQACLSKYLKYGFYQPKSTDTCIFLSISTNIAALHLLPDLDHTIYTFLTQVKHDMMLATNVNLECITDICYMLHHSLTFQTPIKELTFTRILSSLEPLEIWTLFQIQLFLLLKVQEELTPLKVYSFSLNISKADSLHSNRFMENMKGHPIIC